MDGRLVAAALLTVLLGIVHSVLGERVLVSRVLRRDQPKLLGSDAFTKRTIRFVWHAMTLMAFGIAGIMLLSPTAAMVWLLAAMFVAIAVLTVTISRGQHLSWVIELVIAALLAWAAAA